MSAMELLGLGLTGLALSVFASYVTWLLGIRRLPTSHRVAIIGFPQSGKTTLITGIFDFLFRHGDRGGSVIPRGDETIRRINENLQCLEMARSVRPTTEQDVFAYRAEVVADAGFFARRYKLEVGDFPGEDSAAFAEEHGNWLHRTPYFEWALSADAYVFVADSQCLRTGAPAEESARLKMAFRASWQRIREHHLDGPSRVQSKPLIFVFSKIDVLTVFSRSLIDGTTGTSDGSSDRGTLSKYDCEILETQIERTFGDLFEYLRRESRHFVVVLTSVYLWRDGERVGLPELVRRVLPTGLSFPRPGGPGAKGKRTAV